MALVISMAVPVSAQAPIPIIVRIPETFDGTNSIRGSMQSFSFLEWRLVYQDGTETGTTQFATASFEAFPLSFVGQNEMFRTLIVAEVRGIQSFAGIGTDFCHDLPRQTYNQEILVNGRTVDIPKQLFGSNEFNKNTAINKGFGVKFTPALIDSLLQTKGVTLKTGDVVTWKITSNNRYTLFKGDIEFGDTSCSVVRGTAWDGYTVGMGFEQKFVWVDPLEQIISPTTTEPDLDGDGIPDRIDQCDFTPERFNGFQDEDGCPDNDPVGFDPTTIKDQDGDGILDVDDFCPNQPENFNGIEDGDGCPDGAILDVNFMAFEATGQQVVDLNQESIPEPLPPIIQMPDIETTPIPVEDITLIEDNPQTMIAVPEQRADDPILTTGTSDVCDRLLEDCNQEIRRAVQQSTGIMVPFELSLLNLILLIGAVVGLIAVIMFVRRRR